MEEARSLKAVLKEKGIATELTPAREVVGKEIIIHGFEDQPGSYGSSIAIFATLKGDPIKILTSGQVLRSTLVQAEGSFPVKATLKEIKGAKYPYYVLE
uniref:Uncharacterized protein n=1 Tax=viral metagenome TaxID=1070528 RepID=A0A6H1ZPE6_9ZZZZ